MSDPISSTSELFGISFPVLCVGAVVIVIAAFFIIKFLPSGKDSGGGNGGRDPRNLQQYINAVNELINRYNNMRDVFYLAAQEKREAILKMEDTESIEKLGEIMQNFNMSSDDAENMINAIKDELHEGRVPMDKYHSLSNDVEMMEQYLSDTKDIIPTRHEHDWDAGYDTSGPSEKDTDDIDSYFHGCSSKDEVTKRYRALCKVFHPDSSTGDTDEFRKLQSSYEDALKKFE